MTKEEKLEVLLAFYTKENAKHFVRALTNIKARSFAYVDIDDVFVDTLYKIYENYKND